MKRKKLIITGAALVGFILYLSGAKVQTTYALEGWVDDGGGWKYLNDGGQPVTNAFEESNGNVYYLGADGILVKNSLIDSSNGLFYVDENGRQVRNTWVQIKDQKTVGHEEGWYYFGANAKAYDGTDGIKKRINGKDYAFDDNARMETGWLDAQGNALDENDSPILNGTYYAGKDGALWKDKWMDYSSMDGSRTEDLDVGTYGRDYGEYKDIWLYFDDNSKRIKGGTDGPRQKVIDGNAYGFDENGVMLPWWGRVASVSNAQPNNPITKGPVKFYSAYNGGKLLKNTWFWMYPSEELDQKDYVNEEYSWWHTDDKGELYQNSIRKIEGKRYAFDGLGRMKTGFVLFQGRSNFVAQYNVDVWRSDQFKYGDVLGLEQSDLYLFAPDELNDGSMQTGKNIKVELADGVYTFGFGSNGIAYGNGNKLQKVKDNYFINGLRLEADANYGYGVVEVHDSNYIVDVNGKIITGDKKILKDQDGGWLILLNGRFMARVTDEDKPRWHDGKDGPGFYHYDRGSEDKYGDLVTGYGSEPNLSDLPSEEIVYVK